MHQLGPVVSFAILLGAALVGGMVAHRFRQPVILGYLVVGIAVGPHALGLVDDLELIQAVATMGVALLMFTLGLEISLTQLRQVGKVGLGGGAAQILATITLGMVAGLVLFGWPFSQAILFGLVISLSSTMVCLKILMERGELDSVHGRVMLAILIFQDIAVILMVIVQPLLAGTVTNIPLALATSLGKAALFVGISLGLGLWVLPWLMGRVAGVRSRELFLLTVLVLCLAAAIGTYVFGLSVVLGAFVIGLVLRESRFAHQALAEITPLRDVFATLFFVSLGMLLSPAFVIDNWLLILATVAVIIVIKGLVVFGIVRLFGYNNRIAILTGVGLFQIGEFGFILAQAGMDTGIVSDQFYSLILASAIITMMLTPFALSLTSRLHSRFSRTGAGLAAEETIPLATEPSQVVLAGYGRVGESIAQSLRNAGVPYTVIEIDPERIVAIKCGGASCLYGDASNVHVLAQVDLRRARTLVVTFPDPLAVTTTVQNALRINPKLKVVARVHQAKHAETLKRLGVTELVSPEYEASLEFVARILQVSGWSQTEVQRTMTTLRRRSDTDQFADED